MIYPDWAIPVQTLILQTGKEQFGESWNEENKEQINEVCQALLKKLASGQLAGVACFTKVGKFYAIPHGRWLETEAMDNLRNEKIRIVFRAGGAAQCRILIRKPAPLAHVTRPPAAAPELTIVSDRTGAPGAPSSAHLVELEFKKRLASGKVESNLRKQATELSLWLNTTYRLLRPMKPGTIENHIRNAWNARPRN